MARFSELGRSLSPIGKAAEKAATAASNVASSAVVTAETAVVNAVDVVRDQATQEKVQGNIPSCSYIRLRSFLPFYHSWSLPDLVECKQLVLTKATRVDGTSQNLMHKSTAVGLLTCICH